MQVLYKTMLIVTKDASRNLSGIDEAGESLNAFTDYAIENVTENSLKCTK